MNALLNKIRTEPALLSGAIAAVLALAASFGFNLSADQVGSVMAVVTAGLAFLVRSQVSPVVKPAGPAVTPPAVQKAP